MATKGLRGATALLALMLLTCFPIGAAHAVDYISPAVMTQCKQCLEDATSDSGKKAAVAAAFGALGCSAAGPLAASVCAVTAAGASAVTDLIAASSCAQKPFCVQTAQALKDRHHFDCVVPRANPACPTKTEYRTKSINRNGFGTTVELTCNAWKCGDFNPKCTSMNIPPNCPAGN